MGGAGVKKQILRSADTILCSRTKRGPKRAEAQYDRVVRSGLLWTTGCIREVRCFPTHARKAKAAHGWGYPASPEFSAAAVLPQWGQAKTEMPCRRAFNTGRQLMRTA